MLASTADPRTSRDSYAGPKFDDLADGEDLGRSLVRNHEIAWFQLAQRPDLTTPKNGKARTVELERELTVNLWLLRRQLRAEFLLYGMPLPDPLFPSAEGVRLEAANVRRALRSICDKAELRRRSPHDLRRTFASQLLNLGEPITYVSQQLGHSSVAITLSTYARWLPRPDGRRGVDQLGERSDRLAKKLQRKPLSLVAAK